MERKSYAFMTASGEEKKRKGESGKCASEVVIHAGWYVQCGFDGEREGACSYSHDVSLTGEKQVHVEGK